MHFLDIYKQELWERLDFVEAVQRRGLPFLIMQNSHKRKKICDSESGQHTGWWLQHLVVTYFFVSVSKTFSG